MNNDFGPLFESQLNAVRSSSTNDDLQLFGGKIKSISVGKFSTQVGPTCGLVAVRVAASALKLDYIPEVEELLGFCQEKGYTKNGECFSVEWLRNTILNFTKNASVEICDFPSPKQLIETILNNGVYLIPYDSDKNFGPCNEKGHKAHWFVVTGVFVLDPTINTLEELGIIDSDIDERNVHIIGYQGKSKNTGLWSYLKMHESNNQLNEHSPKLKEDSILPDGGIVAGLKSKVLRIQRI